MAELRVPNLNAADARVAGFVFEFVQFLLDDDANLTPTGNLTAAARQKLRGRLNELIAEDDDEAQPAGPADAMPDLDAAFNEPAEGP
jgi:hypothetical protein